MMRTNRAVLAAFLCAATAPATMCDPTGLMSPFDGTQSPTLSREDPATPRAIAGSAALGTLSMPDNAVAALIELPEVDKQPIANPTVVAETLPSTSTAPDPELQSRLLIACLGFVLAVAGGVMLLLPRK